MNQPDKLPDQSWKAVVEPARPDEVESYLIDEIFKVMGARADGLIRAWFRPLLTPIVARFARQAAAFDSYVAQHGFQQSAKAWLDKWFPGVQIVGKEQLPAQGALLIAANHPGTFDSLAVASAVPRRDLRIVASANPFFRTLPNIRSYLIYSTRDTHVRMATIRGALRHLKSGGALLIFPSGRIEPDPLHFKDAGRQALNRWSASLKLILSKVPEVNLALAINSGFVASEYIRTPFARLFSNDEDRQIIAEFLQVIHQVVFNRRISSQPRIIFGEPIAASRLIYGTEDAQARIIETASRLMDIDPLYNVG